MKPASAKKIEIKPVPTSFDLLDLDAGVAVKSSSPPKEGKVSNSNIELTDLLGMPSG